MTSKTTRWGSSQVWVSPNDWKWTVKQIWNQRNSYISSNKNDAISKARNIAKNNKWELFIQSRDWKIQGRRSYWNDNFPPRW